MEGTTQDLCFKWMNATFKVHPVPLSKGGAPTANTGGQISAGTFVGNRNRTGNLQDLKLCSLRVPLPSFMYFFHSPGPTNPPYNSPLSSFLPAGPSGGKLLHPNTILLVFLAICIWVLVLPPHWDGVKLDTHFYSQSKENLWHQYTLPWTFTAFSPEQFPPLSLLFCLISLSITALGKGTQADCVSSPRDIPILTGNWAVWQKDAYLLPYFRQKQDGGGWKWMDLSHPMIPHPSHFQPQTWFSPSSCKQGKWYHYPLTMKVKHWDTISKSFCVLFPHLIQRHDVLFSCSLISMLHSLLTSCIASVHAVRDRKSVV